MKALVYQGDRRVRACEVAEPRAAEGDVVVEVLQAGICGTDLCVVRDERPKVAPPMTLGHEVVGRRLDTGERVVVNPLLSCGRCRACGEGRSHLCERRVVLGVHRAGAFAERLTVPASRLVPAPDASLAQAALIDPIATALHAFSLAPRPAGPVAVLGAGAIGLSMLFVLRSAGIRDITVTDIAPQRLEYARDAGADRVGPAAEGLFDVVWDTVGAQATRRDAVLKVRAGGTAVLVGLHSADLCVPAGPIIGGERTLRGSFGYTDAEFNASAALAANIDARWVRTVPFDEAQNAFESLIEGRADPAHVKIQMRFD
ncbi:MAG TPA: alcohol dehydrogenase catalytic domain-containing protein [Burkholderiaceae bacterium]|mgnify:FL=1|nr:alcohol dehydrogenase catalytic domain-containing protein [Burkholderiaceae bacterium]